MDCREILTNIDSYLTGRLDDETRRRFERHLEKCEKCRIRVENDRLLVDLMSRDNIPDPGESYWDHLENSILSRTIDSYPEIPSNKQKTKSSHKITVYLVPLAASIALMLLSFADIDVGPSQTMRADVSNINNNQAVSVIQPSVIPEIMGSIIMSPPGSPLRTLSIGRLNEQ